MKTNEASRQERSNELWMWRRKADEARKARGEPEPAKCHNKKCRRQAWARVTIPGALVVGLCREDAAALRNSLTRILGETP